MYNFFYMCRKDFMTQKEIVNLTKTCTDKIVNSADL